MLQCGAPPPPLRNFPVFFFFFKKKKKKNLGRRYSLYRMYKSYGFVKYDVYVIPSNIQVTVESPEGEILTQIRHIESTGADYDRPNHKDCRKSRY